MFVRSKTTSKFEDFDFSFVGGGGGGGGLFWFIFLKNSASSWTKNGIGNYILEAYRRNLVIGCRCLTVFCIYVR